MSDTPLNRDTLYENVLTAHLTEARTKRRWKIFFKSLAWSYVIFLTISIASSAKTNKTDDGAFMKDHVALIRLDGIVDSDEISAKKVIPLLKKAFKNEHAVGIVVSIDSPGGSPVEANEIYTEMRRLQAANPDKKMVSVIRGRGASAAYYIAAGSTQIYANKSSLVGSIGALLSTMNMHELAQKVGVEGVTITSGKHKDILNSLKPVDPEDVAIMQSMINEVAQLFQEDIIASRGDRLKKDDPTIFSGLFWTGLSAKRLGLIDDFGSVDSVAQSVFNCDNVQSYQEEFRWEDLQKYLNDLNMNMNAKIRSLLGLKSMNLS
ncbi:MAG: S49 family peptidase [Pseudomonadota bacterium]